MWAGLLQRFHWNLIIVEDRVGVRSDFRAGEKVQRTEHLLGILEAWGSIPCSSWPPEDLEYPSAQKSLDQVLSGLNLGFLCAELVLGLCIISPLKTVLSGDCSQC